MVTSSSTPGERQRSSALGPGYRNVPWALFFALLAVHVYQCRTSEEKGQPAAAQEGPAQPASVVLRVGDEVLRLEDIQAQIDRLPPGVRARHASPEERRAFLDRLIKNEILAHEARRLGYDRDPEIASGQKKAMVLKLLRERLGDAPPPGEITELAIEKYYREHADQFDHPGEVRLTQIVVRDRERALSLHREATELAASARQSAAGDADAADRRAFRDLVLRHSEEDGAKEHGGDLNIVVGRPNDQPEPLVDAALTLAAAGDLSPVIETERGFHILKLRQRVPAVTRSLQESKAHIERLLTDQSRDRRVDELVAALSTGLHVEIVHENLARVRFD